MVGVESVNAVSNAQRFALALVGPFRFAFTLLLQFRNRVSR